MRHMLNAGVRTMGGLALTAALLIGVASGLFHVGQAFAASGARRVDMLAAGVDFMPVGTARQVERAKQVRPPKP